MTSASAFACATFSALENHSFHLICVEFLVLMKPHLLSRISFGCARCLAIATDLLLGKVRDQQKSSQAILSQCQDIMIYHDLPPVSWPLSEQFQLLLWQQPSWPTSWPVILLALQLSWRPSPDAESDNHVNQQGQ